MNRDTQLELYQQTADLLPTPVLIKDADLRYVFVNCAFEELFQVNRDQLIGKLDTDVFKDRQAAQCNGGDLRVLATGDIDEAYETVFDSNNNQREVITRKSRLKLSNNEMFLIGIINDVTKITLLNRQLVESQSELTKKTHALHLAATTDPLTGCNNRRALDQLLPDHFKKQDASGGLILIDLDHFKKINDSYGHGIGDEVLKHVVDTMRETAGDHCTLVRMGGEEFALFFTGVTQEQLLSLAESIRQNIAGSSIQVGETQVSVTASLGVCCEAANDKWTLDSLINQADKALYEAKRNGRNQVSAYIGSKA